METRSAIGIGEVFTSHAVRDEDDSRLIVGLVGIQNQLGKIGEEISLLVETLAKIVSNNDQLRYQGSASLKAALRSAA